MRGRVKRGRGEKEGCMGKSGGEEIGGGKKEGRRGKERESLQVYTKGN